MSTKFTRIDSTKLKNATQGALKKLEEALALLEPLMTVLSEEERQIMLRPRSKTEPMARKLAMIMNGKPDLAKGCGYSGEAVLEDIENLEIIEPLNLLTQRIATLTADTKLAWSAEYYEMTLIGYRFAKMAAAADPKLKEDLDPLKDFFAVAKKSK